MSNKKNELVEGDSVGYLDIQLSSAQIRDLLEVLTFTVETTRHLADHEMIKGTYKAATKYSHTNQKAYDLLEVIVKASRIGYADSNQIN